MSIPSLESFARFSWRDKLIKFLCLNALLIGSTSIAMDCGNNLSCDLSRRSSQERQLEASAKEKGRSLRYAAETGKLKRVQELLAEQVPVDAQDGTGWTALMNGAFKGHIEICQLLIDAKAQINAKSLFGTPALVCAAERGHKQVCQLLLNANAEINVKDYKGWTALIVAAANGHKEICQLLIDMNVPIDTKNEYERTALMEAARFSHKEACHLLIDATLDQSIVPGALVAFLGIKKFCRSPFFAPVDKHLINQMARQAYNSAPKTKDLFAQIEKCDCIKIKNLLLREYAQQQLENKLNKK
jgi:hypothetical protein